MGYPQRLREGRRLTLVPQPTDSLSLIAELAVALAGFSGIVVAIGRRQSGKLSPLDRRRLGNLLANALLALFWSLLGLTLLHAAVADDLAWRIASGGWAFVVAIGLPIDWRRVRALSKAERTLVNRRIHNAAGTAVLVVALLQISNIVHFHAFWPILIAVSLNLFLAFSQFAFLLYSEFRAT